MILKLLNRVAEQVLARKGFEIHSFEDRNAKVYYIEGGNRSSNAPKVVLFHGFGASAFSWTNVMLAFRSRVHFYVLDFPGLSGLSSFSKEGPPAFEHQAKLARKFLDEVVGRADYIVGNSLGGWLGFQVAADCPEQVGHLIAINPAGIFTSEEELLEIRQLYAIRSYTDYLKLMSRLWHRIPLYFYPLSLTGLYQDTKKPNFMSVIETIEQTHFVNELLPNLKIPVSLIWGKNDRLFGEHMAEVILKQTPHVKYYPIENAGHMPQIETPKRFNAIFDRIVSS